MVLVPCEAALGNVLIRPLLVLYYYYCTTLLLYFT